MRQFQIQRVDTQEAPIGGYLHLKLDISWEFLGLISLLRQYKVVLGGWLPGAEHVPKQAQANKAERDGEAAYDPIAMHAIRHARPYLGANEDPDGQRRSPANTVGKRSVDNVHCGAREGHHSQDEVGRCGGDMDGKIEQMNERRHVNKSTANSEEAGEVTDEKADPNTKAEIIGKAVLRAVSFDNKPQNMSPSRAALVHRSFGWAHDQKN